MSGDVINHRRQEFGDVTKEKFREIMMEISRLFSHNLPNTPVYWTLGNYDTLPIRF
jgi:phosphatidate phosphatase APP1